MPCSHHAAGQSSQHPCVVSRRVARATDHLPPHHDHMHPLPGADTKGWQIFYQQHHITANTTSIEWNGKNNDIHGVLIILRDYGKVLNFYMHGIRVTANGRTCTGEKRSGEHKRSNRTVGIWFIGVFLSFYSWLMGIKDVKDYVLLFDAHTMKILCT